MLPTAGLAKLLAPSLLALLVLLAASPAMCLALTSLGIASSSTTAMTTSGNLHPKNPPNRKSALDQALRAVLVAAATRRPPYLP